MLRCIVVSDEWQVTTYHSLNEWKTKKFIFSKHLAAIIWQTDRRSSFLPAGVFIVASYRTYIGVGSARHRQTSERDIHRQRGVQIAILHAEPLGALSTLILTATPTFSYKIGKIRIDKAREQLCMLRGRRGAPFNPLWSHYWGFFPNTTRLILVKRPSPG